MVPTKGGLGGDSGFFIGQKPPRARNLDGETNPCLGGEEERGTNDDESDE